MSVVLSIEDVGPCKKELKVEVPQPAVDAEVQRVTAEFSSQARIPGFRKGKVPPKVVRQRFRQEIQQEVVERLVPRYWNQAQAEKQLDPLGGPRVEKVDFEDDAPLTFTATVEVRPEIALSPDRDFELPAKATEVADSEVDEVLERIREDVAPWKAVDRAAGEGDRVTIELTDLTPHHHHHDHDHDHDHGDDDDHEHEPVTQTAQLKIGDPQVWEELSVAATGLAKGQEAEFTRTHEMPPDPDAPEGAEAESHDHEYKFTVTEVEEQEELPIDDELAKKAGPFEDLDALRDNIRSGMKRDRAQRNRQERENAMLQQLRERNPVDLPVGVVDHEVENMLREWAEDLVRRGADLENAGIDWNEMREQFRPVAERRVAARLLLDAVAAEGDLEVTEVELESAIQSIAASERQQPAAVRAALGQDGRLDELRGRMQREKAVLKLLGEDTSLLPPEAEEGDDESASE